MKDLLLSFFALIMLTGVAMAEEKCAMCGMKVDEGKRQYFVITTKDGKKQKACNAGCFTMLLENIKDNVKSVESVDYNTGKLVDAGGAFYVKGSKIKAVMGGESVVSFSKKEDAEKFQKENGGKVARYDDLLKSGEDGHEGHKH